MALLLQCLRDARARAGEFDMLPPLPVVDAVSPPSSGACGKPGVVVALKELARAVRGARATAVAGGGKSATATGERSDAPAGLRAPRESKMARRFAIAPLTLIELTPPELVRVAGEVGYDAVGLRLSPFRPGEAQHPMLSVGGRKAPMLLETEQRLRDSGLEVLDIEVMLLTPDRDVQGFAPVFEAGALLGAKHALTLIDIADAGQAAERFAALCELAATFKLNCALEFAAWLGVGSVQKANAVVAAAAQPNGCLMLDPFHLFRSGGSVADLADIDPSRLRYAQFCDAPVVPPPTIQAISEEARFERLFPGEGGLPLQEFLAALPDNIPLGLEVPTRQLSLSVGPGERAARALRAAKAVVASVA